MTFDLDPNFTHLHGEISNSMTSHPQKYESAHIY